MIRRRAIFGAVLGAVCGVVTIVLLVKDPAALRPFADIATGIVVLSAHYGDRVLGTSWVMVLLGFTSLPFLGMVIGGIIGATWGWVWKQLTTPL